MDRRTGIPKKCKYEKKLQLAVCRACLFNRTQHHHHQLANGGWNLEVS